MLRKSALIVIFVLCCASANADTKQQHVHDMSHNVMPFDMTKTVHVFSMTDSGGIQKVVVRDAKDSDQVALIRQHLRHEADAFQKGDFGDPSHLHGAAMPGLANVQASAAQIRVTYADIPNGAQLSFVSSDLHTITAIHRWFGAQLSEHGGDAREE